MPRVTLDLNKAEGRQSVKGEWRLGRGLVPGEPNEGLTAELPASPARLADYDDSDWEVCENIRARVSQGFTFAWYRIVVELPETVEGVEIAGSRVLFETNVDDYGEIWVDGNLDRVGVIIGSNVPHRVMVSSSAEPGARHTIACLAVNGPLAEPRGGVFIRYATLAFESQG